MGFDIPGFHIDDDSPEGRALGRIIEREGVTPEEALRRGLRRSTGEAAQASGDVRPSRDSKAIIGLFSSLEDEAILDGAMDFVRENRESATRYYARQDPKAGA